MTVPYTEYVPTHYPIGIVQPPARQAHFNNEDIRIREVKNLSKVRQLDAT